MITIGIKTASAERFIKNVATKQIGFAASNALNNTAFAVQKEEVAALDKYLDRPTPFTKRAYEVIKASRNRLLASVRARQIQAQYLQYQIEGGTHGPIGGAKAIVLPREVGLDRYGNMPKGRVKSLVAQKTTFSGKVKGIGGVWRRTGGKRNPGLKLLVRYTGKATYSERLPFEEVARMTVGKMFPQEFDAQLSRALASAK